MVISESNNNKIAKENENLKSKVKILYAMENVKTELINKTNKFKKISDELKNKMSNKKKYKKINEMLELNKSIQILFLKNEIFDLLFELDECDNPIREEEIRKIITYKIGEIEMQKIF